MSDVSDQAGTGNEQDQGIRDSQHDPSGDMGVSSEREGPTGPGQHGTDGVRDTRPDTDLPGEAPPEQASGGEESNPEGLPPKSGYPSKNPRSEDAPYDAPPDV